MVNSIRRSLLITGCLLLVSFSSVGQDVAGDFRTKGNVNFDVAANWERFDGSSWQDAVNAPSSTDGSITIRNGHNATLTVSKELDQLVVNAGGLLIIDNGQILTIKDGAGTDLNVSGTINNSGTISPSGTINFNASSFYNHNQDGGKIPTAFWDPASNCNITGITTSTGLTEGLEGQTFGNFIWNCPSQTTNFYLESNFTIAGNFLVSGTGVADPVNHSLQMSNTAVGCTITVDGNLVISNNATFKMNNSSGSCTLDIGGNFTIFSGNFTIVTGTVNSTVNLTGNMNISGGTFCLKEDDNAATGILNVKGNFTQTGGTITQSGGGTGAVIFNGTTTQTYSKTGGTISNTIDFTVNSGSTLDVGTSIINGSTGTFTLDSDAGIITAHAQGLSTIAGTGSIQIDGIFSAGADYTYEGSLAQVTGNALPSTVRYLTINSNEVTLTNGVTVNGTQTLASGTLHLNGKSLIISATGLVSCTGTGAVDGDAGSSFTILSNTATGFPVGIYQDVTINSAGGVTLCGNASVNGTLNLINGKMTLSGSNLSINIPGQISGGSLSSYINAESSGTLKQNVTSVDKVFPIGTTSSFLPVTLNNGGTPDTYSVNLFLDVTSTGRSAGTQVPYIQNLVKATWRVIEGTIGGTTNLVVTPQWNTGNEGLTFAQGSNASRTSCSVGFFNGTSWAATSSPFSAQGSDPYTLVSGSINGFSGWGSFGVGRGCFGDVIPPVVTGSITPTTVEGCNAGDAPAAVTTIEALEALTGGIIIADACTADAALLVTSSDVPAGVCPMVITRTYTITDESGNSVNIDHSINISDNIAPTFTKPADITFYKDAGCAYDAGTAATGDVTDEADNCSTGLDATYTDGIVAIPCEGTHVITRTWHLEDMCGNKAADQVQTIIVSDNILPTFTRPADITIYKDVNCAYDAGPAAAGDVTDEEDNCSTGINATYTDDLVEDACEGMRIITRTWHLEDNCGNAAMDQVQTITVLDNIAPTFTAPENITIFTTATCTYDAGVSATGDVTDEADNCSTGLNATYADVIIAGACEGTYIISRTWQLEDKCGNKAAAQVQVITVSDNTPPVWTTASGLLDRTLECSDISGIAAAQALSPVATDNCGNVIYTKTSGSFAAGSCGVTGTYTNTWLANDPCLNTSELFTQVITITDNTAPVWTTVDGALNRDVECSDATGLTAAQALFPLTTDNCDLAAGNIIKVSGVFIPGDSPQEGTYTNTWTVQDACGNLSSVYTQIITITDNSAPVITCPANVTINCEDISTPDSTGKATATDNCTPAGNIAITFNDSSTKISDPANILYYNYVITRTWRATDEAGNFTECTQTITVQDITAPVITCPADVTIGCEDDNRPEATGTATATNNCVPAGNIEITYSDVSTYLNDPANLLHYNYVIIRTWRATDVANNFNECTQTITVHDVTAPVITCPPDVTIGCDDDSTPTGTGSPITTDNCAPAGNIVFTYTDISTYNSDPANLFHYNYIVTRTWKATDIAGNFSECIQTITVHDITAPVITCPVNVTIGCEDDNTPTGTGSPITTDNCAPAGNIVFTYADISTYNNDPANILHYNYIITRTWKATDVAGNLSECIQTITVQDVTAPSYTVPPALTICRASDCTYNIDPYLTGDVTDESDNCTPGTLLDAEYIDDLSGLIDCNNFGFIVRKWTLTDIAGNTTEKFQTIWVEPLVNITAVNDTLCNNTPTSITVTSLNNTTNGIRYTWTVADNPDVTGEANSTGEGQMTGSQIVQTLINTSAGKQLVQYSITPWTIDNNGNNRCAGLPVTVNIWVEPTVNITAVNDTICSNTPVGITVSSINTTTNGIRFTWTVADNPDVTGEANSTGAGQMTGSSIIQTLINTSTGKQLVQYTITPWTVDNNGNNKCTGVPFKVDIWVEPRVNVMAVNDTICNATPTGITVSSINNTTNGIRYTWTVADNPNVTGETNSTGAGQMTGSQIIQVLINTSVDKQLVEYTITPWTVDNNGKNRCPGVPFKVDIWVEPTVIITAVNDTICNNARASIPVSSVNNTTNGIRYTWTVADNPDVTGETNSTGQGQMTGSTILQTLVNTSNYPQRVTYTVTPWTIDNNDFNRCAGIQLTVFVWIEPTARVTGSISNEIICNNDPVAITLASPTTTIYGVRFNVTVINPYPEIKGYLNRTELTTSSVINESLINSGDTARMISYVIRPAALNATGSQSCTGIDDTIRLWINPTPRVIPVNLKPAICFGETTEIALTTRTVMTSGEIKFDYTVSFTGVPGDVVGNSTPGYNLIPDQKLNFPYENSAPSGRIDAVNSVLFAIIPKVVGLGCNAGNIVTQEVKVHPKTIKFNYPATNGTGILITKPLTCDLGPGLAALKVIVTKGADPYRVSWTGPISYTSDSIEIKNLNHGKYTVGITDNLGCVNYSSINIVPFTARPQISSSLILPNIHVSCPGGNDGSIRVYVSSGITAPYQFWLIQDNADTLYNGVFTNNYNPADQNTYRVYNNLKAGNYMLVIRDVNGCEITRTTELKGPAPIIVGFLKSNYNGYNITCRGYSNSSTLAQPTGGNGIYSYFWYPAAGSLAVSTETNLLDSVPAGKYYLVTTDQLGCTKTDSVLITEPDGMELTGSKFSLSPDANSNISCNGGNDGFIKLNFSGGSGVYTYSWTGPDGFTATTKDISGLKAGVYSCTAKDINGCIMTPAPSFVLTEPSFLDIASTTSISNEGTYNISCFEGTGWINLTVSGGSTGTYKYNWSTPDGSGIIKGQEDQFALTAGKYEIVVTDSNKCVISQEITLTQAPSFVTRLSETHITCQSGSFNNGSINLTVEGGIAPYTFLWSNGAITEDIAGLTEGYYKVTVTDYNGCPRADSIRVNLPPALNLTKILSDYNGYNIRCNGLSNGFIQINLSDGLAPFVYTWTGPDGFTATTKDISDLKAGQYELTIRDFNYCTVSETIYLTEPGRLGIISNLSASIAGGFNINCAGDSTGFIDIEPVNQVKTVNYLWADGNFGKSRMGLPAGDYSVIITDANNCRDNEIITLTEPDSMKLVFDINKPFCPDKPDGEIRLNMTGGVMGTDYSYKWSDNSTGRNLSNITKGFYRVIVKDLNGCLIKDSVNIESLNQTCLVIPNSVTPNNDLINDFWNIGMTELYPEMEIKIFNRWGEIIWRSEKGYPQPWDGKRNGSPLPIDSYHYIINLHNGSKPVVGNVTILR